MTNNSLGRYALPALAMPSVFNFEIVLASMATANSEVKKLAPIYPPIIVPVATIKFYFCAFQSNLKKSVFLSAPHIVQRVLKFEDIPKVLSTMISKNIIRATIGPAIYHGHGSYIQFIFIKLCCN